MYADWSRPASVRFVNLPVNSKSKLLSYCKNLVMTKIQVKDNLSYHTWWEYAINQCILILIFYIHFILLCQHFFIYIPFQSSDAIMMKRNNSSIKIFYCCNTFCLQTHTLQYFITIEEDDKLLILMMVSFKATITFMTMQLL